jgi:mannose-6-phosphate isomerase-like protein (cupin superfamily)
MFYCSGRKTMGDTAIKNPGRRTFLRGAAAAAAAGLALKDEKLFAAQAPPLPPDPKTFELYPAEKLAGVWHELEAAPANKTVVNGGTYTIMYTVETNHAAKEFEYHEGRDHILQIVEGTTMYQVGGTPKGAHSTGPGEWLAPESEGATTYNLKAGDLLLIPRGTPHKRTTTGTVKLTLVSPMGVKA